MTCMDQILSAAWLPYRESGIHGTLCPISVVHYFGLSNTFSSDYGRIKGTWIAQLVLPTMESGVSSRQGKNPLHSVHSGSGVRLACCPVNNGYSFA